jgi:hypothetical protein
MLRSVSSHSVKSYDMGPTSVFHLRRKAFCGFLSPLKIHRPCRTNGNHANHYITDATKIKLLIAEWHQNRVLCKSVVCTWPPASLKYQIMFFEVKLRKKDFFMIGTKATSLSYLICKTNSVYVAFSEQSLFDIRDTLLCEWMSRGSGRGHPLEALQDRIIGEDNSLLRYSAVQTTRLKAVIIFILAAVRTWNLNSITGNWTDILSGHNFNVR